MPRQVLVSNGRVAVALDNNAMIRDFYFPYAGLENHSIGHAFKLGVCVDGKFRWLNNDDWNIAMSYLPETLVTRYQIKNSELGVEMEINDAVHNFMDIFLRKVTLKNITDTTKEVRLFFTQDFHIYGYEAGDTALYEPTLHSLIHYKRKRYFLINGINNRAENFYQFAVGHKESEGREGVWRDAEDGQLSGNPVAQGAVDSAVSFKLDLEAQDYGGVYYWIACGKNLKQVIALNSEVEKTGVEQMLIENENYWSAWVNRLDVTLSVLPRNIEHLFKRSLLFMRAHVDSHGGFIASLDSDILQTYRDTYSYIWPRDASMAALAFNSAGFPDVSTLFFQFCDQVINDDGFFQHKYLPDGSIGSTWHALVNSSGQLQLPIQEDETALVLYALWKHYEKRGNIEFIGKIYDKLVVKTADFLMNHRDPNTGLPKPSFDEWEEKVGVFTSTTASVCAALDSAAKFAKVFYDSTRQDILSTAHAEVKAAMIKHLYDPQLGRFIKGIYPDGTRDTTIDSSVTTIFACNVLDAQDERVRKTMEALVKQLWVKTSIGGLARYDNDHYRRVSLNTPGNPWFISTLRLARYYIAQSNSYEELKNGMNLLQWAAKNAADSGAMAEQLNPYTGEPISATPLLWSHAEFVLAVCEYLNKHQELAEKNEGKSV
jgi:GH15 family glucan-1,4-alpha-glucosidase